MLTTSLSFGIACLLGCGGGGSSRSAGPAEATAAQVQSALTSVAPAVGSAKTGSFPSAIAADPGPEAMASADPDDSAKPPRLEPDLTDAQPVVAVASNSEPTLPPTAASPLSVAEAVPTAQILAAGRGAADQSAATPIGGEVMPEVWRSNFDFGIDDWPGKPSGWGEYNRSFSPADGITGKALSVFIAKGSIDPVSMKNRGLPYGGTGFKSWLPGSGYNVARLSYKVKFPADFKQGMGGKIPGLCGGVCNGGGKMPNGTNGFSARYMWTGNFMGSVYAYLPTSVGGIGTPIGHRQIPLARDRWVQLEQEVKLNSPGIADGYLKVWADGVLVVNQPGLLFRTVSSLKIDHIYFDVFYGGSDDNWAAPQDTTIQFAEFRVLAR